MLVDTGALAVAVGVTARQIRRYAEAQVIQPVGNGPLAGRGRYPMWFDLDDACERISAYRFGGSACQDPLRVL